MKKIIVFMLTIIVLPSLIALVAFNYFHTEKFMIKSEIMTSLDMNESYSFTSINSIEDNNRYKQLTFDELDLSEFEGCEKQAKALYTAMITKDCNKITIDAFENKDQAKEFADKFEEKYGVEYHSILSFLNNVIIKYDEDSFKFRDKYVDTLNFINENITNIVSEDMNDEDALNAIIKFICSNTTYKSKQSDVMKLFNEKNGNCVAYAITFNLMCEAVNIDSNIVAGDAGGGHAWNEVLLNNTSYFYDICWTDSENGTLNSKYMHSDTLWKSHTADEYVNDYKYN